MSNLDLFHPLIRTWFTRVLGPPTEVQEKSWPLIAGGAHVLITAPTGSGKTLTAFLWAINQLVLGAYPTGRVSILYVSPLKALNNDIRRNLLEPLEQLAVLFDERGVDFPHITVSTRSGDTPAHERQRMLRHPPEILITTPESLNILLSSKNSRRMLTDLAGVILDEIHAVAGNKRGTHLITAVDRLVPLAGEFQRIALTATVRPAEQIADFIGGYRFTGEIYSKREVTVIRCIQSKAIEIRVCHPGDTPGSGKTTDEGLWGPLVSQFNVIIASNRSTLFFTNSRRLSEKIVRLINENAGQTIAYSHHGSLSRELRRTVEQRLKDGALSAVVATNSLELGIDIGTLDEVVLIQTPFSISSALQRVGRAGHGVNQTSRARIFPIHGGDFLEAAVMTAAVSEKDIEETRPVQCPLDVLSQIIVSMVAVDPWKLDELYSILRSSYPYHNLSRRQFELVLEMLAGRYADSRIRELRPRISIDRIDGTIRGKDGVRYFLFLAGGTIPDRGYYTLRTHDSKATIGELDEEFVWERSVGDSFTLGAQSWRIEKIGHQDVEVTPTRTQAAMAPFWKAEAINRDFHLFEKIALFLEQWNDKLDAVEFERELQDRYALDSFSANALVQYLQSQRRATASDLPHRHHILIEHCQDPMGNSDAKQVILHTFWGGKVNHPFSMALSQAWQERHGYALEVFVDNYAIMLNLPHDFGIDDVIDTVRTDNLNSLLRTKLETTGFFGARFRESASVALLLPRAGFKRRTPLWLNRLRAKKLFSSVMRYEDFPILVETWRSCMQDEFDLESLATLLDEVRRGVIRISEVNTETPSPFSSGLVWRHTNQVMYEDDTQRQSGISNLRQDLIREAALDSRVRPALSPSILRSFTEKLHRIYTGYSPSTATDFLDWLKERLLIPADEAEELLSIVARDHDLSREDLFEALEGRAVFLTLHRSNSTFIVAQESVSRVLGSLGLDLQQVSLSTLLSPETALQKADLTYVVAALKQWRSSHSDEEDLTTLLGEWLRYYGPLPVERLKRLFGFDETVIGELLQALTDCETVVVDSFGEDSSQIEVCDLENLERLLRLARSESRESFKTRSADQIPLFLAAWQGLTNRGDSIDDLRKSLERLFGISHSAEMWEKEIFPARLSTYYVSWLDGLLLDSDLVWRGSGKKKLLFCFERDLDLFPSRQSNPAKRQATPSSAAQLFPDPKGRYDFWTLAERSGLSSDQLTNELWNGAWNGEVSNNTFSVVRQGIETKFRALSISRNTPGSRRHGYRGWRSSRPLIGHWYFIPQSSAEGDALAQEEITRDRIDILFARYGILFRELLTSEQPELRWADVFRRLRLMELSGEIYSGHFFDSIPGIQFITPTALRQLKDGLPEDCIYWLNACDPASLCGISIDAIKSKLPKRLPTTHIVFHGHRLVLVSRRFGKELEVKTTVDELPRYLEFYRSLMNRAFQPLQTIRIETINSTEVRESPYLTTFLEFGFTLDYKTLTLRASYT